MKIQLKAARHTAEGTHANANHRHDKGKQDAKNDPRWPRFSQLPSQHHAANDSSRATAKEGDNGRGIAVFRAQENSKNGQNDWRKQHGKKDQPIGFHWR